MFLALLFEVQYFMQNLRAVWINIVFPLCIWNNYNWTSRKNHRINALVPFLTILLLNSTDLLIFNPNVFIKIHHNRRTNTSKTTPCTDLAVQFRKILGLTSTRYIKFKCIVCFRKINEFQDFFYPLKGVLFMQIFCIQKQ